MSCAAGSGCLIDKKNNNIDNYISQFVEQTNTGRGYDLALFFWYVEK